MSFLGEVIALVSEAFANDTDKGGQPYILHCLTVMHNTKKMGITNPIYLGIAVAHDIGEDKPQYLTRLLAIAEKYGYRDEFDSGLRLVTRRDGETYRSFIRRIANCGRIEIIRVKKADLKHNTCITRLKGIGPSDLARMKKYHRSWVELEQAEQKLNASG